MKKIVLILFVLMLISMGCSRGEDTTSGNNDTQSKNLIHNITLENGSISFVKNTKDSINVIFNRENGDTEKELNVKTDTNPNLVTEDALLQFDSNDSERNIVFGIINDDDIEKVKVRTSNGSLADGSFEDANIISNKDTKIFYIIREKSTRTQVIALNDNQEIINEQG